MKNLSGILMFNWYYYKIEIDYIYSASGEKLKKITHKDYQLLDKTDYILNFIYKNNKLSYVITQEGKITFNQEGEPLYQYFLKDHLGNTRAVIDQEGHLAQTSSYYPFGMQTEALCYTSTTHQQNNYLYNGKELQDDFGLGWYDYGARFYDAQIGRWHVVDPMAEMYNSFSPYTYTLNNPIRFIDPDGMVVDDYFNKDGKYLGSDEAETDYVKIIDQKIWDETSHIKIFNTHDNDYKGDFHPTN
ncbi:MAG: RHS repeat-associated core domain-containing protein [Bacteroidota bacterium]|nr:RHS repeat-associated core domain-containing protein [Bacteroidota bacterium]